MTESDLLPGFAHINLLNHLKREWYQNRCIDVVTYINNNKYHLYAPLAFTDDDFRGKKAIPTTTFKEKFDKYEYLVLDHHRKANGVYKLISSVKILN